MSRLTKDLKTPHNDTTYSDVVANAVDRENIVLTKLKYYEDLEEELGCSLDVVFKALKEGIIVYYEDEERHQFHNDLRLEYEKNLGWGLVYIYGSRCRNDMTMKLDMEFFLLKDYGTTWWLKSDREEINNEQD